MERFHRYYRLHRILSSRRLPVSRAVLERELECTRATVMRVIEELRNYGAPVEYLREANGYRYTPGKAFELPGIWFSPSELEALLVAQNWLEHAEPGLLGETLAPLKQKLAAIFKLEHLGRGELVRRVRILRMAGRGTGRYFNLIADALTRRKRLYMAYRSRSRDEASEREVSPQRLVHYRDNWYLDAWCHLRKGLRSFAVERIHEAQPRARVAINVAERNLDDHFATAYGIFAGTPDKTAVLRFTPKCARWVADEEWHPRQQSCFLPDGSYELRIPYGDPRELVMDILKHGPDVEVLAPPALRKLLRERLELASARYRGMFVPAADA
ncbi:MAG: YafY family transcriptional regulator [Betaproteobacteria bacterium]|nr:YafY family transcriptional regulator [Betaproteobacteria bacterium]